MYIDSLEPAYELKGSENIRNYILGGKGILQLKSPSNVSVTYLFSSPRTDKFPENTIFIYAAVKSDVWLYVGMLTPQGWFKQTWNSKFSKDHYVTKGAKYLVNIAFDRIHDSPMKIYHCGICCRCGRKLKSPLSLSRGIGPKCKKLCKDTTT